MADIFENCALQVNGYLLGRALTISIEYTDEDQDVCILGGGTEITNAVIPSSRKMIISFTLAVPRFGDDLDLIDEYLNSTRNNISVFTLGSAKRLDTNGFFKAPRVSASTGQSLEYQLSAVCEARSFS